MQWRKLACRVRDDIPQQIVQCRTTERGLNLFGQFSTINGRFKSTRNWDGPVDGPCNLPSQGMLNFKQLLRSYSSPSRKITAPASP